MPRWPGRRPRRRPLRRSPRRHIPGPAAGVWPKRGLRRRGETGSDGDSSVRPDRSPGFGKCRPPKRDRHSSAKVSYATLQDVTEQSDAEGRERYLKSGGGRRFLRRQLRHYLKIPKSISRVRPKAFYAGYPAWIRTKNNASKGRCVTVTPRGISISDFRLAILD